MVKGSERGVYWRSTGAVGGRRQEFGESKPEMGPSDSVCGLWGQMLSSTPGGSKAQQVQEPLPPPTLYLRVCMVIFARVGVCVHVCRHV